MSGSKEGLDIKPNFGPEIDLFVRHAESVSRGFMVSIIFILQGVFKKSETELEDFEKQHCKVEVDDERRTVSVPGEKYQEWRNLERKHHTLTLSLVNFPRSLVVSAVSHFDAYVGRLIRTVYLRKPELLSTSERKLTFEELTRFDSIEAVREFVIEKEVESVLRGSHVEQFRWMERTYDVPLTKGLDSWKTFVELMERRNLFVHTDGVVSSQYLSICRQQGCSLEPDVKEGARLDVPQEYFNAANDCILEIGLKLGHVLWRKLFPEEREEADSKLIQSSYDLLLTHRYEVAKKVLDFACEDLKKHSNEVFKLMLVVNRALAYKWSGDQKGAKDAMRGVDWSAKSDQFTLAHSVINDNWASAATYMRKIGPSGSVTKFDYRNWPLFKEWRKREDFKKLYQEIFKEDFDAANVKVEQPEGDSADAVDNSSAL